MSGTAREEFLSGKRPDDVLIYLSSSAVGDPGALGDVAEAVEDGTVLVLPGERGRSAFESATGVDPMDFAGRAMQTDGHVDRDCTDGDCPAADDESGPHDPTFVFAFAEAQNEEVGGIYAEGDVVHAYASCACGTAYSDRWVVDGMDS